MNVTRIAALALLSVLFLATGSLRAQKAADTTKPAYGWFNSLFAGVNLSQVALKDWTKGGESSVAWTGVILGTFVNETEKLGWRQTLKLTYGQTKLGSQSMRKNDDELFYENLLAFKVPWKVDPYAALQVRSQLAAGYAYGTDADGHETQTITSGFFDPGYIITSVGFSYAPVDWFGTRFGIANKQTFAPAYSFAADDPGTVWPNGQPDRETYRQQTGVESGTYLKYAIMENVVYQTQLNLFSAFDQLDVWDVRWDNNIGMRVNSIITATLGYQLVYAAAESPRTQMKEALAVGLAYKIL
jgi:hypothetical protein